MNLIWRFYRDDHRKWRWQQMTAGQEIVTELNPRRAMRITIIVSPMHESAATYMNRPSRATGRESKLANYSAPRIPQKKNPTHFGVGPTALGGEKVMVT